MSAILSDASGFNIDVVSAGSNSPDRLDALAQSVEESVSVKISDILARSLEAEGVKNPGARKLVSVAKRITAAISEFLSEKRDASKLLALGYNPSVPGMTEAFALGFLHGGRPETAVGLLGRCLEIGNREEFLRQFLPVFETAVFEAKTHSPDKEMLSSLDRAIGSFLKILWDRTSTGYEYFALWRLSQLAATLSEDADIRTPFAHYVKGFELGEPLCALMLSRLYFQNGQDPKGFEVLEFAWSRFQSVEALLELSNRLYSSGRIAESLRYYRILSGTRRSRGEVMSFPPDAGTLSFPRDIETIRSYLLTQESSERFTFVERSVLEKTDEWLRREFRARATLMERHAELREDEHFEDRLALLQFWAIELSSADFAARYLDELSAMLSLENGKAFLRAFFEEHGSGYAEAFIMRLEDGPLVQFREEFGIGTLSASSDAPASSEEGEGEDASQSKRYRDLWEAMAHHLSALAYRFQYFGDEDILERILAVAKLLDDADGALDEGAIHISADMEDHLSDLKQRRERFERFPQELQDWYYSLLEKVSQNYGESFVRTIMTNAYHVLPVSPGFPVEAYLLYVSELLISGAPDGGEALSQLLSSLPALNPDSDDIAHICSILIECGCYDLAVDVALGSDPSNPRIMRHVLQSAVGYPSDAEQLFEELAESLQSHGIELNGTVLDYVIDQCETFSPDSEIFAISKGNAGLMFQAFVPDPKLLLEKAIPFYDEAASLWDVESAFFAARCYAYWIKDREEAEKRFLALFRSGFDFAALDLFETRMAFSDRNGAREWLLKCEQIGISDIRSRRITYDLSGDRNDRISAIRSTAELFLHSDFNESLPEEILKESLRHALLETSPLGVARVAFDSRMAIDAYLHCLRFIAILPPDAKYGGIKVPENAEISYWETLAGALSDPSLRDQAATFLRESTGHETLNALIGVTLTATEEGESIDSPTLSALIAEMGLFRKVYGIPSDPSENESNIDEDKKVFIVAFYTVAAQTFLMVKWGERLAGEYLTTAERFVPKRSEYATAPSATRH